MGKNNLIAWTMDMVINSMGTSSRDAIQFANILVSSILGIYDFWYLYLTLFLDRERT